MRWLLKHLRLPDKRIDFIFYNLNIYVKLKARGGGEYVLPKMWNAKR